MNSDCDVDMLSSVDSAGSRAESPQVSTGGTTGSSGRIGPACTCCRRSRQHPNPVPNHKPGSFLSFRRQTGGECDSCYAFVSTCMEEKVAKVVESCKDAEFFNDFLKGVTEHEAAANNSPKGRVTRELRPREILQKLSMRETTAFKAKENFGILWPVHVHDKHAAEKGWERATKKTITEVEVSKGRWVKGVIHDKSCGEPVGTFELSLVGSKAIETESELASSLECFGNQSIDKKQSVAMKAISSLRLAKVEPDEKEDESAAMRLTSSAKKRKRAAAAEGSDNEDEDAWLSTIHVKVRDKASARQWRQLNPHPSDATVTSKADSDEQEKKKKRNRKQSKAAETGKTAAEKVKEHKKAAPKEKGYREGRSGRAQTRRLLFARRSYAQ